MLALMLVLTALIYLRHWANIERIKAGTEPKIGAKKA
jgi:glycerol-3-phosphate acyltransferase PlsY